MIRVSLAGILGHKLRAALTAIAIVLGVAMVSGTLVLTDSIDKAFDSIFTEIREGSTVVITGRSAFDLTEGSGSFTPTLDDSLLPKVRALPGVAAAEGGVDGEAQLIDVDGEAIVFGGAPNIGFSIGDPESPFNPLTLEDGRWPGPNEVVVNERTFERKNLVLGQTINVQSEGPMQTMRLVGVIGFASGASLGGATLAGFDIPTAQKLFNKPGELDEIAVAAAEGVSEEQLLAEIEAILPSTAQAKSGAQQAADDAAETNEFISFLRGFLLAFGGIALFVGSFVIANSLSITIAQRTREFATLRTLGATRRQVLSTVVLEALTVGVLASIVGVFAGLALATGLFSLFDSVGFTLPNSGLVLETQTIVIALAAGILVSLLASLRPAIRATRVPPIAAVREGATLPPSRLSRFRTIGSIVLTALGFAALSYGLFAPGLGTQQLLIWMGLGALLIFFGVALFATRIASPLATAVAPAGKWLLAALTVLFWPFWLLPFWLLRLGAFGPASGGRRALAFVGGLVLNPLLAVIVIVMRVRAAIGSWRPEWPAEFPGVRPDANSSRLARNAAQRNPQRTASTASALMIGLALVTLVAVLAAGITSSFRGAVEDLWGDTDYAITALNNFTPLPATVADAAAQSPGVESVGSVRTGEALAFGGTFFATAVNPETTTMFNIDWIEGSAEVLASLGADGAFVDDGYADEHDLAIDSPIVLTFANGESQPFFVRGIFDPPTGGSPFGNVTISSATWDRYNENPRNLYAFVRMAGGQTEQNQRVLERSLNDFPNAKVQTRQEFIDNQISALNAILNILYVLLALSVIVSLFGIVNTLVLTVFERTRELGMLRAIGMTRRQVRRMIRYESVITALIGGALGIVLGIVLGGLLVVRVDFIEFTLPVTSLIVFAVATILVGIVAAILPARRAAKLNVLEALQYE